VGWVSEGSGAVAAGFCGPCVFWGCISVVLV
jgi:hypothetical protein